MAYLEDIPKCALGTACKLIDDSDHHNDSHDDKSHANNGHYDGRRGDAAVASATASSNSHNKSCDAVTGATACLSSSQDKRPQEARCMTRTEFKRLVGHALRAGCRHLDCAPLYRTQSLVGEALRECEPELSGEQVFVTTKVPPNMMRPENLVRSVQESLRELQLDRLDLVLLHAPFATRHLSDNDFYPTDERGQVLLDQEEGLLEGAWRKLAELKKRGLTRYIGLSNVNINQLDRLNDLEHVDVVQNEYHIYLQNRELFDHCEEIDTHFEAYAVFGSPHKALRDGKPNFARDPVVQRVAKANARSVAAVNIQWIHQQPLSYVLGCDSAGQFDENMRAASDSPLPLEDLIHLDSLNRDVRVYTFADEHKGLELHAEFPFELRLPSAGLDTGGCEPRTSAALAQAIEGLELGQGCNRGEPYRAQSDDDGCCRQRRRCRCHCHCRPDNSRERSNERASRGAAGDPPAPPVPDASSRGTTVGEPIPASNGPLGGSGEVELCNFADN